MILEDIDSLLLQIDENAWTGAKRLATGVGNIASGLGHLSVPLTITGGLVYGANQMYNAGVDSGQAQYAQQLAKVSKNAMSKYVVPSVAAGALTGATGWHYLNRKTTPTQPTQLTSQYT
jgi:hypothetical protein